MTLNISTIKISIILIFILLTLDFSYPAIILRGTESTSQYVYSINLSPNILTCTKTALPRSSLFTSYQGIYDAVSNSYSFSSSSEVLFFFLNGSTAIYTIKPEPSKGVPVLVGNTAHNGIAYIIYYIPLTGETLYSLDMINISDLSLQKTLNITADPPSYISFTFGHPLLFRNDKLYYEVYNESSKFNQIVQIDFSEEKPVNLGLNWIPGWSTLSASPDLCHNIIYGVQYGTLYSIDPDTGYFNPIISLTCAQPKDQQFIQYAIDFDQEEIIALTNCAGETPKFFLYHLNGTLIYSTNSLGPDCPSVGDVLYGLNIISEIDPYDNCTTEELDHYFLYFLITIGSGVGVILILGIMCTIFMCSLKKRTEGYFQSMGFFNGMDGPSVPEILSMSGGQISNDEIQIKELIGHGSYSEVYRGFYHDTEVAIKVIKSLRNKDIKTAILEEAGLMISLRHPNIVLFMGACIKDPNLFIVTEFMYNGSIRNLLDNKELFIEQEHVRKFAIDTCKGMIYLHKRKIIHRDLKSHNLFVDENWNVKVGDFGLSRSLVDESMTNVGTPSWAAPEVLKRNRYTHKADIYSFGICLWEMLTRERPYINLKTYQVAIGVVNEGLRPDVSDNVPHYFISLMKQCWSLNPDDRPEFTDIREEIEALILPVPECEYPIDIYGKEMKSKSLPNILIVDTPSTSEMNTRKKLN